MKHSPGATIVPLPRSLDMLRLSSDYRIRLRNPCTIEYTPGFEERQYSKAASLSLPRSATPLIPYRRLLF